MARAPEIGRVKTRLAATVGTSAALEIYRWLGRRAISAACEVRDATVVVQLTPANQQSSIVEWLGAPDMSGIRTRPQVEGDLGARMRAAIADALDGGATSAIVIGTDSPDLSSSVIEQAFDMLAHCDVVLGPAYDGGYYLLGVRAAHPVLFEDIPWSTDDTMRRTIDAAQSAGLRVALLDSLADIDTADDWRAWTASAAAAGQGAPGVLGSG